MYKRLTIFTASAFLLAILPGAVATAETPSAPGLKPDTGISSTVLSSHDNRIFRHGLQAATNSDWRTVARLESRIGDETGRKILIWLRARHDSAMDFAERNAALVQLADWPMLDTIKIRTEQQLADSNLDPQGRIDWFTRNGGPQSGSGHILHAQALRQLGQHEAELQAIRTTWHEHTLTRTQQDKIHSRYKDQLTQNDHRQRVDFLLWTQQVTAAARMKPLLTADWQALVEARIRLMRRSRGVDRAIAAIPRQLHDHPGLLFDRARWRKLSGMAQRAIPLLRRINGADVPLAGRKRLWKERHLAARTRIRQQDWQSAYDLVSTHGLKRGVDFAQAEWLAGWIALRHQGNSAHSLEHFKRLEQGVTTPVSRARALYWQGRALETLQDMDSARDAYADAAHHATTYYGQLAAHKIAVTSLTLPTHPPMQASNRDAFANRSLVRALRLFAENDWNMAFRTMARHLAERLTQPQDFLLLADLGTKYHYADIGVRTTKTGLAKGITVTHAAWPLVDHSLLKQPRVELALILALSRQESEMNPAAVSHAGARGLMQLMPDTARPVARRNGFPWRTSWLTDDPGYNMTLGSIHLGSLIDRFNGSYILALAAYNAGSKNAKRWIRDYGDPRSAATDPVDWIESIPFSETRNYVQRVLESTQVYRHRLDNDSGTIRLHDDLHRGRSYDH